MCFWFFRMLIIIYIYRLEKYIRLVCTTRKNGIKFSFFFLILMVIISLHFNGMLTQQSTRKGGFS